MDTNDSTMTQDDFQEPTPVMAEVEHSQNSMSVTDAESFRTQAAQYCENHGVHIEWSKSVGDGMRMGDEGKVLLADHQAEFLYDDYKKRAANPDNPVTIDGYLQEFYGKVNAFSSRKQRQAEWNAAAKEKSEIRTAEDLLKQIEKNCLEMNDIKTQYNGKKVEELIKDEEYVKRYNNIQALNNSAKNLPKEEQEKYAQGIKGIQEKYGRDLPDPKGTQQQNGQPTMFDAFAKMLRMIFERIASWLQPKNKERALETGKDMQPGAEPQQTHESYGPRM